MSKPKRTDQSSQRAKRSAHSSLCTVVEFTAFCGDPKQSGSPITCAEATKLRERSRRGRRKLRADQSDIKNGRR